MSQPRESRESESRRPESGHPEPRARDSRPAEKREKLLTFELAGESYGLEALKVSEIIRMTTVTRIPNTPPFVRGVMNLRGRITPVVDLRLKFGLEHVPATERTCIVVVRAAGSSSAEEQAVGLVVDGVEEVLDLSADRISGTPDIEGAGFVRGIARWKERMLIILDIERVLGTSGVELVEKITREASRAFSRTPEEERVDSLVSEANAG